MQPPLRLLRLMALKADTAAIDVTATAAAAAVKRMVFRKYKRACEALVRVKMNDDDECMREMKRFGGRAQCFCVLFRRM